MTAEFLKNSKQNSIQKNSWLSLIYIFAIMALRIVEFSNGGYKVRKILA